MNFLAHLYLSGQSEARMVGNFMGDFVKGAQVEQLPADIAGGVRLHRAIDHFTDTHAVVAQSKDKLREKYRHYSGVIVDMYYDHFLARLWEQYHLVSLDAFAAQAYTSLRAHWAFLPERARYMLPYMEKQNWLSAYAHPEGIDRALTGMSHRTRFDSGMQEAVQDLLAHYEAFEAEFQAFFPDLMAFVKREVPGMELGGEVAF